MFVVRTWLGSSIAMAEVLCIRRLPLPVCTTSSSVERRRRGSLFRRRQRSRRPTWSFSRTSGSADGGEADDSAT